MRDGTAIQEAMRQAVRDTVREHKLLGYPIVVWRDGKVVWVPPEEIVLPEETDAHSQPDDVQAIKVRLNSSLLQRVTALAKRKGLSLDRLIAHGLRVVLAAEKT
jgi:hypothetical protein